MPHPTWGTVPAGPPGWAYGANCKSAQIAKGSTLTQCAIALSNQIPFFRQGQLAQYIANNQQVLECPKDVAMRGKGAWRDLYAQRWVKLTAYTFSGAVCGAGSPKGEVGGAGSGKTYKISDFRPTSFFLWETDETDPFNFNDAGQNQEDDSEGVSQRHGTAPRPTPTYNKNFGGGAMLGTFGLTAQFGKWQMFDRLRTQPAENDRRCGPGYR
jgi:hypothetical protein